EDDPVDQPVCVVHLLDALFAALLGELAKAPIGLKAVMQPVLADRGQFGPERLVEIIDNTIVALHRVPLKYGTRRICMLPERQRRAKGHSLQYGVVLN